MDKDYGDRGRGVCLGIRVIRKEPYPAFDVDRAEMCFVAVSYDRQTWEVQLKSNFEAVMREYEALPPSIKKMKSLRTTLVAMYRIAAYAAIRCKNPEWSHENEWRQVFIVKKGKMLENFQQPREGVIELRLRQQPKLLLVDEVILGPKSEHTEEDVFKVFRTAGYPTEESPLPHVRRSATEIDAT